MKMTDLEHNIIKISTNISQLMQYWLNENNYSVTSVTKNIMQLSFLMLFGTI